MELKRTIWVVEDDTGLQFVYGEILGFRYDLRFFDTLTQFRQELKQRKTDPDLLIVDLRLPDGSFLDLLTASESEQLLSMPFLIVSSVDDLDALRICFEEGAIDYISKPFGKSELIVKIERIFQRERSPVPVAGSPDLGLGGTLEIELDPVTLTIRRADLQSPPLTSKEYQILSVLISSPRHFAARDQIVGRVWQRTKVTSKTLDVHLFNLRKKLAVLGVGLVFQAPHSFQLIKRSGE